MKNSIINPTRDLYFNVIAQIANEKFPTVNVKKADIDKVQFSNAAVRAAKVVAFNSDATKFQLIFVQDDVTKSHPDIFEAKSETSRHCKFKLDFIKQNFNSEYIREENGTFYYDQKILGNTIEFVLNTFNTINPQTVEVTEEVDISDFLTTASKAKATKKTAEAVEA